MNEMKDFSLAAAGLVVLVFVGFLLFLVEIYLVKSP